jgi:hypothetical protein
VTGEIPPGGRAQEEFGAHVRVGDWLTPLSKSITAEQAAVFSRIGEYVSNIHNSLDLARAGGLRVPIVQGQQQFGMISQLLTRAFGAAWFTGGRLQVKFIAPLNVFDPVTITGVVTAVADGVVELEVWVRRDSDQRLITVGWASAPVPA